MANNKYYVVEARLPIQIDEAVSPEEAARKAARLIEREYGVNISNWYLRIFEYGGGLEDVGVTAEYFSNPSGSKFRVIDGNITKHNEMVEKGITPNDQEE
jgi:hypothetical protein